MLTTFSREEFVNERWRYNAGEHVTLLGYTGSGKTTFGAQLLQATAHPKLQAVVFASKPRDITMTKLTREAKFKQTPTWPPLGRVPLMQNDPAGYTLWPRRNKEATQDETNQHKQFKAALEDAYWKGNKIVFVDEILDMIELDLKVETVRLWRKGRSMGTGLWGGCQQPTFIPTHAYSQAAHIFLANESDKRKRARFAEISGGIDPKQIENEVLKLPEHHFLYIRTRDRRMCIVGAD